MRIQSSILILFLMAAPVVAKNIWVAPPPTGNNANSGLTIGLPKATLAGAKAIAVSGDVIRALPGTYDERGSLTIEGLTWMAEYPAVVGASTNAVCRGFDLSASNNKIIGFEITHIINSNTRGILLTGTTATNNLISDNYIHNVCRDAISVASGAIPSYVTVRGNYIYEPGIVPGVITNVSVAAIGFGLLGAHHNVIEYNIVRRSSDFQTFYGTNSFSRNNSMGDFSNSYYGTVSFHSDMFQMGSASVGASQRNTLVERNFCFDSVGADGHFMIIHDQSNEGDTNILVRQNVTCNFGSTAGVAVQGADDVNIWNNTFTLSSQITVGLFIRWFLPASNTNLGTLGGSLFNDIFADDGVGTTAISIEAGTNPTLGINIGYLCGTNVSFITTNNPLFVDLPLKNFRLLAGSPAINAGTNMAVITSPDGSGTAFNVSNGNMFRDGYGIVDGDVVTVGSTTTRITSITGNAVTVADSVSWVLNQPIYLDTDTTPDIGALPFGSVELTSATMIVNGTTYTVSPTGDTRGVWFYENGIPTTWVKSPPYVLTSTNAVTAKAYALYAQIVPVVTAVNSPFSVSLKGAAGLRGAAQVR